METDDDQKFCSLNLNVHLNEIWRTCRKIQAAIFRYGFNINYEFSLHDPHAYGLISESKFTSVLGKYKRIIGLSDFEIRELTDYYRIQDGRIAYKQFCGVLCEEGQDHSTNVDNVCGLEWSDPMHVNILTDHEKRHFCILMMKIAKASVIPLLPYFQDYELVTKNSGTVTVAHFSRVLHFMKLALSEKDFMILLKRYMKDSYTVNYVAFVKHIDALNKYLKEQGLMNQNNNVLNFPGHLIDLEVPELSPISSQDIKTQAQSFDVSDKPNAVCGTILRIQRYIYENRIRTSEFMEPFDPLKIGSITRNQFLRALDSVGISSGSKRFKLSQREIEMIFARYADPIDMDRIKWKLFVDEIDRVFTEKNLDKQPQLPVQIPLEYIKALPKPGQRNWQNESKSVRDLCEETIRRIQNKINTRRIYLHPFFKNYDKLNKGYVRPNQALQALLSNTILISEVEFAALEGRYCNDMGFNYMRFLEDVDPAEYAIPKFKEPLPLGEVHGTGEPCLKKGKPTEEDVILALSKVKKQAAVNNVKIYDFFVDYDHHKENQIPESDFRRGLDNANIKLTVPEADIICDIFRSSNRGCTVRYRDFCNTLDEIFIQEQPVQHNTLSTPLKHFPCVDCTRCFLNFEERTIASRALQKLARKPDQISNLRSLFKDFDKENCGTVTQNQFLRALTVRDMNNMISSHEFEVVCKCFGYERGLQIEFDYRSFLDIINILHETGQVKRQF